MPNTENDFWRMVLEKRLSNIVMLTKCTEAGRVSQSQPAEAGRDFDWWVCLCVQRKCEQYWAENIGDVYTTPDKKVSVVTTSVMPFADFAIRTFTAKRVSNTFFSSELL